MIARRVERAQQILRKDDELSDPLDDGSGSKSDGGATATGQKTYFRKTAQLATEAHAKM